MRLHFLRWHFVRSHFIRLHIVRWQWQFVHVLPLYMLENTQSTHRLEGTCTPQSFLKLHENAHIVIIVYVREELSNDVHDLKSVGRMIQPNHVRNLGEV